MSDCTIQECPKEDRGGGLCSGHRHRLKRYGDPLGGPRAPYFLPPKERFWHYVDKTSSPKGCWLWKSRGRTADGYVIFQANTGHQHRRTVLAHRYAWELIHGQVPEEELHHTCYVRHCVNTDHLIEISHEQNLADGNGRCRLERLAYECLLTLHNQSYEKVDKLLNDMDNGREWEQFPVVL